MTTEYPYFVLRHMPTVYSRGALPSDREEAIAFVRGLSQRSGKRCCAVFGPEEVVYAEPDGSERHVTGGPVPDGYSHVRLPRASELEPETEPVPTWRSYFRVWDRAADIWSVQADIAPVVGALETRGVGRVSSLGGWPGGRGGTDVTAMAFLDGGLHRGRRDGFVYGAVSGTKLLGEHALIWCCHVLGVAPPRTCPRVDIDAVDRLVTPVLDAEARNLLAHARTRAQLVSAAEALASGFEGAGGPPR